MPRPRLELFRTRVARRLFGMFLLGAIVPVLLLGAFSWWYVTLNLRTQAEERLNALADNSGSLVTERLAQVSRDLAQLVSVVDAQIANSISPAVAIAPSGADYAPLMRTLDAVTLVRGPERSPLIGDMAAPPVLDDDDLDFLHVRTEEYEGGPNALLRVSPAPDGTRGLFMARAVRAGVRSSGVVWGRIVADSLWSTALQYTASPDLASFCVVDESKVSFFCDGASRADLPGRFREVESPGSRALFELESADETFLAAYQLIFIGSYHGPDWFALVSQSESIIYRARTRFAQTFPGILILGLAGVVLMTNYQVRRTMQPLEQLMEGTRRVTERDFSQPVTVDGSDEFGLLGDSFNLMSSELGLRFRQLEAGRAIDRAALTGAEQGEVVQALVEGFATVLDYDRLVVFLTDSHEPGQVSMWWTEGGGSGRHEGRLSREDIELLKESGGPFLVRERSDIPDLLMHGRFGAAMLPSLILPVIAQGELEGVVALGRKNSVGFTEEEVDRCSYVVDQAAVAFNTVQLIDRLQGMSWGTLNALARAIDAKSQWTSGHSSRVTRLAVELGRNLDLSDTDLELMNRGGLLHDLGKIGIPGELLDSPLSLTPEQRSIMQEHTTIGARILEPVPAFKPMIPLVLQHHERLDGGGYPQGLVGDQIHPLARILAVADVFDAMVSARPYRPALEVSYVTRWIQSEAGIGYEPDAVEALVGVLGRGWVHQIPEEDMGVLLRV